MKSYVVVSLILAFALAAAIPGRAGAQGLFSSEAERAHYRALLEKRRAMYPMLESEVFASLTLTRDSRERDALTFMLATSPLSDLAGKSDGFFLDAVRTTL